MIMKNCYNWKTIIAGAMLFIAIVSRIFECFYEEIDILKDVSDISLMLSILLIYFSKNKY